MSLKHGRSALSPIKQHRGQESPNQQAKAGFVWWLALQRGYSLFCNYNNFLCQDAINGFQTIDPSFPDAVMFVSSLAYEDKRLQQTQETKRRNSGGIVSLKRPAPVSESHITKQNV